jgi:hypothetical protein
MSITLYHKMWGGVSMKEKRDVSGVRPFEKSVYLLVCSPVIKALKTIQIDICSTPLFTMHSLIDYNLKGWMPVKTGGCSLSGSTHQPDEPYLKWIGLNHSGLA